jgi:hypothetical protein
MSQFDPNQFLDMAVTESNDTVVVPVPEGEYTAVAEDVKTRTWQSKDGSQAGLAVDIIWDIDSPELKEQLERKSIKVKQGIMLDLTEAGGLDMGKGKNVTLGRLRAAIGLNVAGQAFRLSDITGRVCKVAVKHRVDDKVVPPVIYAEVRGNAPA